jgi:hypothetical protein
MVSKSGDVVRCSYSGLFSSKRGQVTVFIIIGIVILFTFAGIMYFNQTFTKESILASADPIISDLPQTFQPIATYTEGCLNQIGKKGLLILGEQGGYIYPDLIGKYSAVNPTDSDGINLEPLKVPYWHYNVNDNPALDFHFSSLKPDLYYSDDEEMSIEAQLSRYVKENLKECLDDYAPFSSQGINVEFVSAEVNIKATVGEETVNFLLNMPLKLAKGEAEQDVEEFYVKIPIRLKHYYEVASEIAAAETDYNYLERQGLDLIATYSGMEFDNLPPTEEMTFDAIPGVFWSEQDVEGKFKGMLVSNIPMLRYFGSENFYRYEYEPDPSKVVDLRNLFQKNYDNMIIPLDTAQGLNINFDYFAWPIYFDLNDKGGRIEPSSNTLNFFKLNFYMNHYYVTYDASYPVLVTLSDDSALMGEGYNFVFALESNIRNNQIVEEDDILYPPIASSEQSMACDEDKKGTGIIKSVVVDSYSRDPLSFVQLGFSIPESADCILGQTDGNGEFSEEYPAVYGGVSVYTKEDYLTNFYPIDTYTLKDQPGIIGYAVAGLDTPVVEMHKYKTINITVKKKSLDKCINGNCYSQGLFSDFTDEDFITSYKPQGLNSVHSWVFTDAVKSLSSTESVTITLNRIKDINPNVVNDEFFASASVIGDNVAEMELVPGIYEVSILGMDDEDLVFPKEERCTTVLGSKSCNTFDEIVMNQALTGMVQWDEEDKYFILTPEQLYGSNEITFYLLNFNLYSVPIKEHVRVVEDVQVMGGLGNYSRILRDDLEPSYN